MITIIIPIYNADKYLPRCIESVLNQSSREWKLILVDDGSKDASGAICDKYAQNDERITVIHKRNEGVSAARNIGIQVVDTEWLTFMDADDCIKPDAIATIIKDIQSFDTDVFNYRYNFITETDNVVRDCVLKGVVSLPTLIGVSYVDIIHSMYNIWNNVYRRSIILRNNLFFDCELSMGEDRIFNLQYIKHCKSIYYSEKSFYQYYWGQSETSLSWMKHSPLQLAKFSMTDVALSLELSRQGYEIESDIKQFCWEYENAMYYVVKMAIKKKYTYLQRKELYKYIKNNNKVKDHPTFMRLGFLSFSLFYWLYSLKVR